MYETWCCMLSCFKDENWTMMINLIYEGLIYKHHGVSCEIFQQIITNLLQMVCNYIDINGYHLWNTLDTNYKKSYHNFNSSCN